MKQLIIICMSLQLLACAMPKQSESPTDDARLAATPDAAPRRTITNFSASLQCMDSLFLRYAVADIIIGATDIPDRTQSVNAGTTEMLITALSNMSVRSRTIRFNVYDPGNPESLTLLKLHEAHKSSFQLPKYFIRGAITQVDKSVIRKQKSGGIRLEGALNLAVSEDSGFSIVSLDMNMGDIRTLEIIPSMSASNSIAVVRKGKAVELGGTIKKFGALFEMDFTSSEGLHHAVRTLVELGAIELIGKLSRVPYWECLDIETTNPLVQNELQDWYGALTRHELLNFVQNKLKAMGYYRGPVSGTADQQTKAAVITYKQDKNLIANSELDFLLYYTLMADRTRLKPEVSGANTKSAASAKTKKGKSAQDSPPVPKIAEKPEKVTALEKTAFSPLELELTTDRGEQPVYRRGEAMTVKVRTSVDAYLYCFYQQWDGKIMKIFPNRFRPTAKRPGGQTLTVPGDDQFAIMMETAGKTERLMCLTSTVDLDKKLLESEDEGLLRELVTKDLQPIAADTLVRIYGVYQKIVKTRPLFKIIEIKVE